MKKQFHGKVAIVTGAGMGIGRATALLFAIEGAKVVVADINMDKAQETVSMIKNIDGDGLSVKTDVTKAVDVKAMVDETIMNYGRLDFACNNAGIGGVSGMTAECTEENWDNVIDVNLKGVWLCMKYEIPEMLRNNGGAIVNIASVAALVGGPGIPAYSASKGGVVQITRTAALEYAMPKGGIRVNAICPSLARTPMGERIYAAQPELEKERLKAHPMGRMVEPEEVAEAVIWLCSDKASFVTGHIMAVEGGFLSQ
ncbi:MAG: SDR family oxidoreductase [Actinobacteria bacterium]|nr:SDR family oxidoreductase [Actinomycetota bacterium]